MHAVHRPLELHAFCTCIGLHSVCMHQTGDSYLISTTMIFVVGIDPLQSSGLWSEFESFLTNRAISKMNFVCGLSEWTTTVRSQSVFPQFCKYVHWFFSWSKVSVGQSLEDPGKRIIEVLVFLIDSCSSRVRYQSTQILLQFFWIY